MSVSWISDQFREVLSADFPDKASSFTTDLGSTRLYRRGSFEGVFCLAAWRSARVVNCNGAWQRKSLREVISQIQQVWQTKLIELNHICILFKENFQSSFEGKKTLSQKEYTALVLSLKEWYYGPLQAFRQTSSGSVEQSLNKISTCFSKILNITHVPVDVENENFINEVTGIYLVIILEKLLKKRIPYLILKKVASVETLNEMEIHNWNSFVKDLAALCNSPQGKRNLSVAKLHEFFKVLIDNFELTCENLIALEWEVHQLLKSHGCNIFLNDDKAYMQWVEDIAIGKVEKVISQSATYEVGEELTSEKKDDTNKHRVFAVKDDPSSVIVFARNAPILLLEVQEEQALEYGLNIAQRKDLSPKGFVVYQRLGSDRPDTYQWDQDVDVRRFKRRLESFYALLKHMCDHGYTPKDFNAKMLRFDENDKLCFIRHAPQGPFDYDFLTNFTMVCISENEELYRQIVEASGLTTHPISQFYKKVFQRALLGDNSQVDEILSKFKLIQGDQRERLLQKAKNLQQAIVNASEDCSRKIQRRYCIDSEKELQENIRRHISYWQDSIGAIPTTLILPERKIITNVLQFQMPLLKKDFFESQQMRRGLLAKACDYQQAKPFKWESLKLRIKVIEKICHSIGIFNPSQIQRVRIALEKAVIRNQSDGPVLEELEESTLLLLENAGS